MGTQDGIWITVLMTSVVAATGCRGKAEDGAPGWEGPCGFPETFVRAPGNPLHTPTGANLNPCDAIGDPFVLHDADRGAYRMWYTSLDSRGQLGIAQAESSDGIVWEAPTDTDRCDTTGAHAWIDLVLGPQPGTWDAQGIETSSVVADPNGGYRMYFSGDVPTDPASTVRSGATKIGVAFSMDGQTWSEYQEHGIPTPILEAEQAWETPFEIGGMRLGGPGEPSVLWDANEGVYKLWYAGIGLRDPPNLQSWGGFIGYATSTDGIHFVRRAEPVLEPVPGTWEGRLVGQVHVIADPAGGYHMFYMGYSDSDFECGHPDGCAYQHGKIGHAYSEDGVTWQRNPNNPVLRPDPGHFDGHMVFGPSALIEDGKILLWYFGSEVDSPTEAAHFGLATAECPGP